jgi:hypothetical protein
MSIAENRIDAGPSMGAVNLTSWNPVTNAEFTSIPGSVLGHP